MTLDMKKYIISLACICIMNTSCKKFLTEDYLSGENSETIVSTEETMESLVVANYAALRIWYGTENGWDFTESGTDNYTRGFDNRSTGFCTYSNFVGEEQNRSIAVWYELYKALNACNLALANIDKIEYRDPNLRSNRKGELYFLRAHYLWQITENWGPAHFSTEPVTDAAYEALHTPIDVFYTQIFADLDSAIALTPSATGEYGRITQPISKAFAARIHLNWASYKKNGLEISGQTFISTDNTVAQQHYALAKSYASELISNSEFALINDWSEIWNIGNIKNSEIIFAVNYSDNSQYTTGNFMNPWDEDYWDETKNDPADFRYNTFYIIQREGGNMGHLMWEIRYENLSYAMVRDIQNGRGFQRWMPTKHFIESFHEDVDQRFYGSFKNVWYANDSNTIPKWKPFMYIDGVKTPVDKSLWRKRMFALGDTAIYFSKTPVPKSQKAQFDTTTLFYFHPVKGYLIIDINDMYLPDGTPNDAVINRQYYFPITKKYQDTTRTAIAQQYSKRDAYVIRLSEMYLIEAEADLETGAADDAYNELLILAEARSKDHNGASLLSSYGVNSGADITIDFLLDERGRELATENLRFFDLKRTGKLVERVKAFNTDASPNIKDFHNLRFIPQEQLDAVKNPQEFTQNPGY
jgi:hypothetical protein